MRDAALGAGLAGPTRPVRVRGSDFPQRDATLVYFLDAIGPEIPIDLADAIDEFVSRPQENRP